MLFFCYFNESSLLLPKRNQEYPLPQENFVFTRFIQLKYTCSLTILQDLLYILVLVSKTSFVSIQLYFTIYHKENQNMYPNFLAQAGLYAND